MPDTLPPTGATPSREGILGVAFIVLGSFLVIYATRRRPQSTASHDAKHPRSAEGGEDCRLGK